MTPSMSLAGVDRLPIHFTGSLYVLLGAVIFAGLPSRPQYFCTSTTLCRCL